MRHPARRIKDWWRGARLLAQLARHPGDILPYLSQGAFAKASPLELAVPWWSFRAVRALEPRLHKGMDAFEFGSGGSSIYLASRVRSLISVEDEESWVEQVREAAAARDLRGLTVLFHPYNFWNTRDFASSDYLLSLENRRYDLIVVDGKEWSDQVRDQCFWKAEDHIKPGGLIVLDDAWRYPQVFGRNRAKGWKHYRGAGYCRVGVTSTAIFDY